MLGSFPARLLPAPRERADGGVITPWGSPSAPELCSPGAWHSQGQEASREPGHPLLGLSNSPATAQPHPKWLPGTSSGVPRPLLTSLPASLPGLIPHPLPPALQLPKFCQLSPSCGSQTLSQGVKPTPSARGRGTQGLLALQRSLQGRFGCKHTCPWQRHRDTPTSAHTGTRTSVEPLLLLPDLGQDRDGTIPSRCRSHSWGSELCSHFLRVAGSKTPSPHTGHWKASRLLHTFPCWRNRLFNLPGWIQDV